MKDGYYQRKYHFKYTLPDGNIYSGFINVEAPEKDSLPAQEDLKGSFWVKKDSEGWHGEFTLDNGPGTPTYPSCMFEDTFLSGIGQYVMSNGVHIPDDKIPNTPITSMKEAEKRLKLLEPIQYEYLEFSGRLEDYITSIETHFWEKQSEKIADDCEYER